MHDNRRHKRDLVRILVDPVKIEVLRKDQTALEGKVWDISAHGFSVMVNNYHSPLEEGSHYVARLSTNKETLLIPVVCRWRSNHRLIPFVGFETNTDLTSTWMDENMLHEKH